MCFWLQTLQLMSVALKCRPTSSLSQLLAAALMFVLSVFLLPNLSSGPEKSVKYKAVRSSFSPTL
jgi:hypothetical protein